MMGNKIKFLVILVVSIIAVLSTQIANALNYGQISQIANEITVLIDGCDAGSGFIYQRQDNTYYFITAKHVFDNSTVGCLAIAPDGATYDISSQNITIPSSSIDLAVVSFSSENDYEIASFGDSQQAISGKTVYVAGAPAPSAAIPQRTVLTVDGNIVGRQPSQEGYELIYNNPTSPGMSGGTLLNTQGQVIGIHGQGDRINTEKTGLNLAIPIETFLSADLGSLPKPILSANSLSIPEEIEEEEEVNYTTLENQLKKLAWKEANDTTVKIMLQLVGREDEGWFSKESLAQLPCNDLKFTDSLWHKYSNNKFGLGVQKTIFEETVVQQGVRDVSNFDKFSETIGWRNFKFFSKDYDEITYNLNAPKGHLPVLPGVVPLAATNVTSVPWNPQSTVSVSIQALQDKASSNLGRAFVLFFAGICIFAFSFGFIDIIFKETSSGICNKTLPILLILACVFIVLGVSNCSSANRLQQEVTQKSQQYFERINKNRPIEGSELLAGIEPLISILERCEFSELK